MSSVLPHSPVHLPAPLIDLWLLQRHARRQQHRCVSRSRPPHHIRLILPFVSLSLCSIITGPNHSHPHFPHTPRLIRSADSHPLTPSSSTRSRGTFSMAHPGHKRGRSPSPPRPASEPPSLRLATPSSSEPSASSSSVPHRVPSFLHRDVHSVIAHFLSSDRDQASFLRVCHDTHACADVVSWRNQYRHDCRPARGHVLRLRIADNPPLQPGILPARLEQLTFSDEFDQLLIGMQFLLSLQQLTFGDKFDQSLEGFPFPPLLQKLTFGDNFNQSLVGVHFPSSLQQLTLGHCFNQLLFGVQFPSSLQQLRLGFRFNQSLVGVQLPPSLQLLKLGFLFRHPMAGVQFPSSLLKIILPVQYEHSASCPAGMQVVLSS